MAPVTPADAETVAMPARLRALIAFRLPEAFGEFTSNLELLFRGEYWYFSDVRCLPVEG